MKVRAPAALSAKGPLEPFEYDVEPLGPQARIWGGATTIVSGGIEPFLNRHRRWRGA
jgi:hypothetical protein